MNYFTRKAWPLHDPEAERMHGPSNELESYYLKEGDDTLFITTDEREEYERENGIVFNGDVIEFDEWHALFYWLRGMEYLLPEANVTVIAASLIDRTITLRMRDLKRGEFIPPITIGQLGHIELL